MSFPNYRYSQHQKDAFSTPNLPGFALPESAKKSAFHKQHTLDYRNGYQMKMQFPSNNLKKSSSNNISDISDALMEQTARKMQFGEYAFKPKPKPMTVKEFYASLPRPSTPLISKYDGVVLTFDAYLKEIVPADVRGPALGVLDQHSNEFAIRRVIIKYFMEDHTLSVVEPVILNSGLNSGPIVKRQHVCAHIQDAKTISIEDIEIGKMLTIFGKEYHIVSADLYTQKFLKQEFGRDLHPTEESMPVDPYVTARENAKTDAAKLNKKQSDDAWLKEKYRRFVKDDRKVLRFFCEWDDSSSQGANVKKYNIHYYLVDDTVEVVDGSHGKIKSFEEPSILLRRSILPKKVTGINDLAGTTPLGTEVDSKPPQASSFYNWRDFKIGSQINVLGREFIVLGVDGFTKEFYVDHGISEGDLETIQGKSDPIVEKEETGKLDLKDDFWLKNQQPHQRNFAKMIKYENQSLTFKAKVLTDNPVIANLVFILSFKLGDEMISVLDPAEKARGEIGGGKIADRAVCVNFETRDYYRASDFYIGSIIHVQGRKYNLIEADEFTLKFMEQNSSEFPYSALLNVLKKLNENNANVALVANFGGKKIADLDEVSRVLSTWLNPQEVITFSRAFQKQPNMIDLEAALSSF